VHTNYLIVIVSEVSYIVFRDKGGAIWAVNENVVSHMASKEMLLSVDADTILLLDWDDFVNSAGQNMSGPALELLWGLVEPLAR